MVHIGHVDHRLIDDGTYYVIEGGDEVVACGGWSRRDKLFSGSAEQEGLARLLDPATEPARIRAMFVRPDWTRRGLGRRIIEACEVAARAEGFLQLDLVATLTGVPLYRACGFTPSGEVEDVVLADGVRLPCLAMSKPIARTAAVAGSGVTSRSSR
jgi:GNAT superfamily N-acetyltransferase